MNERAPFREAGTLWVLIRFSTWVSLIQVMSGRRRTRLEFMHTNCQKRVAWAIWKSEVMSVILKDDTNQEGGSFVILKAQYDSNHPFKTTLKLYK